MKLLGWSVKKQPSGYSRFGGGWEYSIGVQTNKQKTDWVIDLLLWSYRVRKTTANQ